MSIVSLCVILGLVPYKLAQNMIMVAQNMIIVENGHETRSCKKNGKMSISLFYHPLLNNISAPCLKIYLFKLKYIKLQ